MANIRFTETALSATGKKGILTPDADGYYELVVGGLNTLNSSGEYYTLEGAKDLFEESSIFMRRVRSSKLYGETGHPQRLPNQSIDDYISRILRVDEKNTCCHFKEIWLDLDFGKKNPQLQNPQLVAIMAKVKPAGPMGPALEASLKNTNENVSFSIRALTEDYYHQGKTHRVLRSICTWDLVRENGIHIASKQFAPGLESLSELSVSKRNLEHFIARPVSVATEGSVEIAVECLKAFDAPKTPTYAKW